MYKILQKDFRKLTPPVLAVEYDADNFYENFDACPRIYYSLDDREVSEPFPILMANLSGVTWADDMKLIWKLPLGESVPTSNLETSASHWDSRHEENNIYIVYEPEDIQRMINKLEACIHD